MTVRSRTQRKNSRSPSHVVERELKIKEDRNQTSTITKPSLPPNNNQQGASTKSKETWSPKPVKCYQDVRSVPPNRVSPSGSSSDPAVSISLLLFCPQDAAGVRLQVWVTPGEAGRRGSTGHQNQQPWPHRSRPVPADKYLWNLPWNSLGLWNAVSWRPAPGEACREKERASALCFLCLEKRIS